MKTKIKTLCWGTIPIFLISFALLVTSCQQEEIYVQSDEVLKKASADDLSIVYPDEVFAGEDFVIEFSSTCGKVLIQKGFVNGDPIFEGGVIIGYEKKYVGLYCETPGLQWEYLKNGNFSSCTGGILTENIEEVGAYLYRAVLNNKAVKKSGCPSCNSFKGNLYECFMVTVTEKNSGTFTDGRDENIYNWVRIGDQVWMAENLAWLPSINPPGDGHWGGPFNPNYYVYDYYGTDVSEAKATYNYSNYGVLYNWPAATTACPTGWHLPTDDEITILTNYLITNGFGYEGSGDDITKSMASTSYWRSGTIPGTPGNDPASNNLSGFTGIPGGLRYINGAFYDLNNKMPWWSSTKSSETDAIARQINDNLPYIERGGTNLAYGYSVRCLRDF